MFKLLIFPPIETGEFLILLSTREIPDSPLAQDFHEERTLFPKGDIKPSPVTTTLLCSFLKVIYEF